MKDSPIDSRQMIEPLPIAKANDFVDKVFAKPGYNARRLGEASKLYKKMLHEDVTVLSSIEHPASFRRKQCRILFLSTCRFEALAALLDRWKESRSNMNLIDFSKSILCTLV
jgi:hypothetical protein